MSDETVKTATIMSDRADRLKNVVDEEETKWAISLCEIGDCSSCL